MNDSLGGIPGSRAGAPSQSTLSRPIGFDPGREEWDSAGLALRIEGLFADATDNACTCGSAPEDHCRYCAAWAVALYKTEELLAEVLGDR